MSRISLDTLTGALTKLANEWDAVRAHQAEHGNGSAWQGRGSALWWVNQTGYLGERFGTALIDDLREARGLPPRRPDIPTDELAPGLRSEDDKRLALLVPCATCEADRGEPCFSDDGRELVDLHAARLEWYAKSPARDVFGEYTPEGKRWEP